MGNESSSMNGNSGMDELQKQILENQLEIQRIQIQNLQNQSSNQPIKKVIPLAVG